MFRLALLVSLFSCTVARAQLITDSILVDGHYRSFYYNNPGDSKRSSLMFVMHGSGGNGKNMFAQTKRLEERSKDEQLLLVYPNGYLNYWNECRKAATSKANV